MALEEIGGINLGSGFSSGLSAIVDIMLWVFIASMFFVLFYYMWREFQFKYLVTIHEVDKNGFVKYEKTVKARKITKDQELQLKKTMFGKAYAKIPIPGADYWKRAGKTWKLYLQHDGVQAYAPAIPSYNSPLTFTIDDYAVYNQFVHQGKKAVDRHQKNTFWNENKGAIMFISAMAFAILIIIISLEKASDIAEQMFRAAQANAATVKEVGKQVIQ